MQHPPEFSFSDKLSVSLTSKRGSIEGKLPFPLKCCSVSLLSRFHSIALSLPVRPHVHAKHTEYKETER